MAGKRTLPAWLTAEYGNNGPKQKHRRTQSSPSSSDVGLLLSATETITNLRKSNTELRIKVAGLETHIMHLSARLEEVRRTHQATRARVEAEGIRHGKATMHRKFRDLLECHEFAYELKYGMWSCVLVMT